ncbi:LamG domain-containing protein [Paludisphaera mucosa]|uniref:LamG domain-containing protein n=1 Tax=Paludisphaera mucosa TaxID=3030827 RepID=A0ABT6FBK7_9BACT|nr:LamG domain-containing protein [Paludisphaera mucosa]MDG3004934.1 LamG domain-containing protein [Paludisphaera mucosa]
MKTAIRGLLVMATAILGATGAQAGDGAGFRAGAATVDVSPTAFPVIVNGGFLQATATANEDPLHARCIVLDDGTSRLAIVIVDSCMMPRELIDDAKARASKSTGIAVDRMLVAATHTHTAPSVMGALGTPVDPAYAAFLPGKIAEAIEKAAAALAPAEVGWGVVDDPEHTHTRRWIRRPDRIGEDPFGDKTVRANMHPGHVNPDAIAPSGPSDPALTVLAIRAPGGRPIAVLANYSMHYYGATPVSADYYGRFAASLARKIAPDGPAPICIMSQGTSGDQQWMDYGKPKADPGLDAYAEQVAASAFRAYQTIKSYQDRPALAMAETTLTLGRRTPGPERLEWARKIVAAMGDRPPKSIGEVYPKEAVHLHDEPERTLKLQAVRVGDLGIVAIPDEVYALTGLKLKARSPLPLTMNVELANGSEGYIPPPEQHALGGYTTWPARTAGLEVQAEPKILDAALGLLERVAGKPRRGERPAATRYAGIVLGARPAAFWRLDEMDGADALDATGRERAARRRGGVALFLPGPDLPGFRASGGAIDRASHLAGGAITADLPLSPEVYSVDLWFWNGLEPAGRAVAGVLFERGRSAAPGDAVHLSGAVAGTPPNRLVFTHGDAKSAPATVGKADVAPKAWHHLALVRQGRRVLVYLDGALDVEADADVDPLPRGAASTFTLGDRGDHAESLEGKLDEVAVYDRVLSADEVAEHVRAAFDPSLD